MSTEFYISKYVRPFFEDYLMCRKNLSICTIRSYRDVVKMLFNFAASHYQTFAIQVSANTPLC